MSPWLNTSDVAEYLRYTGEKPLRSVYRFMERHSIVARKEGKRLLIARADLDRALAGLQRRRSHVEQCAPVTSSTVMTLSGNRGAAR
jgi:hypothetical protein